MEVNEEDEEGRRWWWNRTTTPGRADMIVCMVVTREVGKQGGDWGEEWGGGEELEKKNTKILATNFHNIPLNMKKLLGCGDSAII